MILELLYRQVYVAYTKKSPVVKLGISNLVGVSRFELATSTMSKKVGQRTAINHY